MHEREISARRAHEVGYACILATRLLLLSSAALLAGGLSASARSGVTLLQPSAAFHAPALIAVNGTGLEYWPLAPAGARYPRPFSGAPHLSQPAGIAADGHHVVIADGDDVVIYDVRSGHKLRLPDPYGVAIDVAIGKTGAIYAPISAEARPTLRSIRRRVLRRKK